MQKIMKWLSESFAPRMSKLFSKAWISGISSAMQKILPFILAGSLIFFYNVFRSYIPVLPDLGRIADYSFGMLGMLIAYMMASQLMEKLQHVRYMVSAGLVSICVFLMFVNPKFDNDGNMTVIFSRFGATGIMVGMIAGLMCAFIFNMYSKLHVLENNTSIPDFVTEWINNIIPIIICLAISSVLVFEFHIDVFAVIIGLFSPLASFGQTLPGFILICLIPAFLYSLGISSWLFNAVSTPIFMAGIQANINAVAKGLPATNIVTSETVFTAALITMGGMGATLTLNILMCRSKSKKLRVMGRIFIGPSIFNINEPVMFGAPVVFNPLLMLPMWINSITAPIVIWIVMKNGLLNIPSKMIQIGQIPAPISSIMITQDWRAVLVYVFLFVLYLLTWYPFFKVYEKKLLAEENESPENGTPVSAE